ncbi:MAG: FAD-dependent monooxygenase [Alphaproteobacteria bacterium]|nr:FAD-dependent monooxygenase [Alphaproteobacteria bacterium]
MTTQSVLISGAGVAGPTLAWWLARQGMKPTVVEQSARPRSSGSPVDVRGPALRVAEQMGIVDALRGAATQVRELVVVDAAGRAVGRVDMAAFSPDGGHDIEIPRGDLARILYEASRDDAEYVFGDQIVALDDHDGGVDVSFERGAPRRFDLVVGADGLHSGVRQLAFGPESELVRPLGMFVATNPLPGEVPDPHRILLYNTPGRAIAVHPARDRALAAFIFHHPGGVDFRPRDPDQHRQLLREACADDGWRTQELLARALASPDLYFDAVSEVVLSRWSRGRITLLGDAASCVSLFGGGSSLAMAGAHVLAEALAEGADVGQALARYERRHRRAVIPRQRGIGLVAGQLVPRTRAGLATRNLALQLMPAATRFADLAGRLAGRLDARGL